MKKYHNEKVSICQHCGGEFYDWKDLDVKHVLHHGSYNVEKDEMSFTVLIDCPWCYMQSHALIESFSAALKEKK